MYIITMNAHQRFSMMTAPGLILIGFFFGLIPMLIVFAPVWLIYKTHVKRWTLWQFAWRSTVGMVVMFFVICQLTGV